MKIELGLIEARHGLLAYLPKILAAGEVPEWFPAWLESGDEFLLPLPADFCFEAFAWFDAGPKGHFLQEALYHLVAAHVVLTWDLHLLEFRRIDTNIDPLDVGKHRRDFASIDLWHFLSWTRDQPDWKSTKKIRKRIKEIAFLLEQLPREHALAWLRSPYALKHRRLVRDVWAERRIPGGREMMKWYESGACS